MAFQDDHIMSDTEQPVQVMKCQRVVASTVCRWLRCRGLGWKDVKKGVHIDGHERQDVIGDWSKSIARLEKLWPMVVEFDDGTRRPKKYPKGCIVGGSGQRPVIINTYDESTFSSNNR